MSFVPNHVLWIHLIVFIHNDLPKCAPAFLPVPNYTVEVAFDAGVDEGINIWRNFVVVVNTTKRSATYQNGALSVFVFFRVFIRFADTLGKINSLPIKRPCI